MKFADLVVDAAGNGTAQVEAQVLRLRAAAQTDWFFHPEGILCKADVVRASRMVDEPVFSFSARVTVDFASAFDAGALFVQVDAHTWAKLAFERSGAGLPTAVSVITRGTSDDADGPSIEGNSLWLRVHCTGRALAFHFSSDGWYWQFLRWFTLPGIERRPLRIGFAAQSPTGEGCAVQFSDLQWGLEAIEDLRNGS